MGSKSRYRKELGPTNEAKHVTVMEAVTSIQPNRIAPSRIVIIQLSLKPSFTLSFWLQENHKSEILESPIFIVQVSFFFPTLDYISNIHGSKGLCILCYSRLPLV